MAAIVPGNIVSTVHEGQREFREWLEAKGSTIVGSGEDPCNCPIANWLDEKFGITDATEQFSVGNDALELYGLNYPLPEWATCFVNDLDANIEPLSDVTGDEAIAVMDALSL